MNAGDWMLNPWTIWGKNDSAYHDPVVVLLAGKTSTAPGPWWLNERR